MIEQLKRLEELGLLRVDVGELGERLALELLGGQRTPVNTPGVDLVSRDGRMVQVKSCRVHPRWREDANHSGKLSRGRNEATWYLWVWFRPDLSCLEALLVPCGAELNAAFRGLRSVGRNQLRKVPGARVLTAEVQTVLDGWFAPLD